MLCGETTFTQKEIDAQIPETATQEQKNAFRNQFIPADMNDDSGHPLYIESPNFRTDLFDEKEVTRNLGAFEPSFDGANMF